MHRIEKLAKTVRLINATIDHISPVFDCDQVRTALMVAKLEALQSLQEMVNTEINIIIRDTDCGNPECSTHGYLHVTNYN
jgi:hypothetical protein